ncbi:MAG: PilZ domain-containing protein [Sphingomonadaceae bacterium]|jgi:hypothetical protein
MNTQPSDGRAEPRVLLMVEGATLRVPGGSAAKVTLRDLSRQGFCTEWPYVLHRGQRVWLKFPDFEIFAAKVAWDQRYVIGCEFDTPLHQAVFSRMIVMMTPD